MQTFSLRRRHQASITLWAGQKSLTTNQTTNQAENLTTNPATILLIDDNAIQAATRQTILKRAGYSVIAVLNPQRALEQFRNNEFPADIDVVITDHIMPGMNGSALVRELREIIPDLPVMVISGLEEAEVEYAGMDVVFRLKPLIPDNLLASVHSLVLSKNKTPDPTPKQTEAPPTE